jgi:hypothetical protein
MYQSTVEPRIQSKGRSRARSVVVVPAPVAPDAKEPHGPLALLR